ncbi:hypothetical protein VTO73DRAFT_11204 [Trametes versicolor]
MQGKTLNRSLYPPRSVFSCARACGLRRGYHECGPEKANRILGDVHMSASRQCLRAPQSSTDVIRSFRLYTGNIPPVLSYCFQTTITFET